MTLLMVVDVEPFTEPKPSPPPRPEALYADVISLIVTVGVVVATPDWLPSTTGLTPPVAVMPSVLTWLVACWPGRMLTAPPNRPPLDSAVLLFNRSRLVEELTAVVGEAPSCVASRLLRFTTVCACAEVAPAVTPITAATAASMIFC